MKKFLSFFLTLVLVISLCACSGGQSNDTTTEKAPEGKLLVGYGRADITPPNNLKLFIQGYGDMFENRYMTGFLDPLYGTCIAITDAQGETVLIYTVDQLLTTQNGVDSVRKLVTEKTGIPPERIVISATHTHSSYYNDDYPKYFELMAQAAVDALADRAPATVQTGSTDITDMSFVRHYNLENGIIGGDNFNYHSPVVSHTTQPDTQLQMIRYLRDGDKKDILLVNWQAHPKLSSTGDSEFGNANRSLISADFIGHCRMDIEKNEDCLFAYFSGACGNLNAETRLATEKKLCSTNVSEYGKELSKRILTALPTLTDVPAGQVSTVRQAYSVTPVVPTGVSTMELTAIRIGTIGFATVPFEMFDTNGKQIKEESNTDTTFVLTNSSGYYNYIPAEYVWDYDTGNELSYELSVCKHEKGTAEKVATELASMLNTLAQ